jgi:hypothetical protein
VTSATDSPDSDLVLWRRLVASERQFVEARMAFLVQAVDRIAVLRQALWNAADRGTALRLAPYLREDELKELCGDLLRLAVITHAEIAQTRDALALLPRSWLIAKIRDGLDSLLWPESEEQYRRLLELVSALDEELAAVIATRALQHQDPEVREVGEDFSLKLHRTD